MATEAKNMWVANSVEAGNGLECSVPVYKCFEDIDKAAEMGHLIHYKLNLHKR
jgi:hypothetical protein